MNIRRLITLIVGITSVAVSPITWAAGHGGGGRALWRRLPWRRWLSWYGTMGGEVGNRGGGVGFGGMHVPGRVPSFEAQDHALLFWASIARATSIGQFFSFASGDCKTIGSAFLEPSNHVVSRHDSNWHNDWDRRHAHFNHSRFFVFIDGFWCGLDAGYFPWDYLPYYPNDYYPYDYYTDVDPYGYNGANYNVDQTDSAEVQAVQMQLARLGYYNGSIDGVFGPSTRDAVAEFKSPISLM